MIPSPILKVLSTIQTRHVQALLMGGQACVFYGAVEFSRDADLAVLASAANLESLRAALTDLKAECIAVPPLSIDFLQRGHAVHFRSHHPDADGMRIDVMSVLRGVDPFPQLWQRRTTVTDSGGLVYDLLQLPDLVKAKKTQRDKDWPVIRRLVEAHYLQNRAAPTPEAVAFWLRELRTPELLLEAAGTHGPACQGLVAERALLAFALSGNGTQLAAALKSEEEREREIDREYWKPLRTELERLRGERRRG